MNYKKLLLLLPLLIVVTACKSDNQDNQNNTTPTVTVVATTDPNDPQAEGQIDIVLEPENDNSEQVAQIIETMETEAAKFTTEEIAVHKTKDDCWIIIDGEVWDATVFVATNNSIVSSCGKDGTSALSSAGLTDDLTSQTKFKVGEVR